MANILDEIHNEHANMAALLRVLEAQIEIFAQGGRPDYDRLQDIVLYFADFPDECHHPKEDLIAAKLVELAPERAARLRGLGELHEELSQLTRNMAKIVGRILDEAELPRSQLVRATKEFIESQRHHMRMEEEYFLPLADELLSDADLSELDDQLFAREDPLFGAQTQGHYAMLRDFILKAERTDG